MPLPNRAAASLDAEFEALKQASDSVATVEAPPPIAQGEDAAYQEFLSANGMGPQATPPPTADIAPAGLAGTPMTRATAGDPGLQGLFSRIASTPEATDAIVRSAPLAGAVGGGILGGATAGVPGALGGATMGNMAGEIAIMPYRASQNDPAKPATQIGAESLVQGASELFGPAVSRILNFGAKKAVGNLQRDIPIDTRVLRESIGVRKANDILKGVAGSMRPALERKYGKDIADNMTDGVLMATDLTENRIMDTVENFAGNSIFAGRKLSALREAQQDIINEIPSFIAKTYGEVLDPEDAMNAIASTIGNIDEIRRGQAGSLFDYVGTRMGDTPWVNLEGVGSAANSPTMRLRKALSELNQSGLNIEGTGQVLDIASRLPDRVSFNSVKALRTYIGNIKRSLREVNPKNTQIAVLSEIDGDLGSAMRKAVKQYDRSAIEQRGKVLAIDPATPVGEATATARKAAEGFQEPPLSPVYRFANESYGDIEKKTGSAIIEGWMESITKKGKGPEAMGKLLDTPSDTRLFLDSVGRESRSGDMARQWYVEKIWRDASPGGSFNPSTFEAVLTNLQKSDSGVARELFGDDGLQDLKRFAAGPKFIRTRDATGGTQAARFAEAGLIVAAALAPGGLLGAAFDDKRDANAGDFRAAGIGVASYALSMGFVARALGSKALRGFILDTRRFGPKTQRGATAVAHLVAAATKDEIAKIPQSDTREGIAARNRLGQGR